jgi:hypothetical protein
VMSSIESGSIRRRIRGHPYETIETQGNGISQ